MSRLIRRWPRLARLAQNLYRHLIPRFTVGAVGVLFNDQAQVLLVEHAFHSIFPWGLPGGWVDRGELPHQTVEREFLEETGLHVVAGAPLAVWTNNHWRHHLDMAYVVRLADGAQSAPITLSTELLAYQWASPAQLPPLMADHQRAIKMALAQTTPSSTAHFSGGFADDIG